MSLSDGEKSVFAAFENHAACERVSLVHVVGPSPPYGVRADVELVEELIGPDIILFYPVGIAKPIRIQGCYLSDKEVESVVDFIKKEETSSYDDDVMQEIERQAENSLFGTDGLILDPTLDFGEYRYGKDLKKFLLTGE